MSSGGRRSDRDDRKTFGDRGAKGDSRQSRTNSDRRQGYGGDYSRGPRSGRGGRSKVGFMFLFAFLNFEVGDRFFFVFFKLGFHCFLCP